MKLKKKSLILKFLIDRKPLYRYPYHTPNGMDDLVMLSDGDALTGLLFEGSPNARKLLPLGKEVELPVFDDTRRWLDIYFGGREPNFTPRYRIDGMTSFRKAVTECMCYIPYGSLTTYGTIATVLAKTMGHPIAAQAVGGAVGWNPLCIIVPCHRVVGAGGLMTGYGGGIHNKIALLKLEGHQVDNLRVVE